MAGEIIITGPLKFIGYEQTAEAGTDNQVLTYDTGEAVWKSVSATVGTTDVIQSLTYDYATNSLIHTINEDIVASNVDDYEIQPDTLRYSLPEENNNLVITV